MSAGITLATPTSKNIEAPSILKVLRRFSRHNVVRESGYIAVSQIFVILLGFANSALLARLLGPEQFGIFQILLAWAAIGSVVGLPGMTLPILKGTLKNYDRFYWIATKRSIIVSSLGTMLIGAAGLISVYWIKEGKPTGIIMLLVAAGMPLAAFQNYESFFVGKRDFRVSRLLQIWSSAVMLILTACSSWIFDVAEATYAAAIASRILTTTIAFFAVQKRIEHCTADPEFDRNLLSQGWRQTAAGVLFIFSSRLDRIVVGAMSPALLAHYCVGILIPARVKDNTKLLLSVLGTRWGLLNTEASISALNRNGLFLVGSGLLCFVGIALSFPTLIPILFGNEYQDAVWIGTAFSITVIPSFWNHIIGLHSQIQNNGKFNQYSQLARHIISSAGILIFGQKGIEWVLGSLILADISLTIMSGWYLWVINRQIKLNKKPIT